jgi:hypothetical protein
VWEVTPRIRHFLILVFTAAACAKRQSPIVGVPVQMSAADTTAIVAAAMNYFATSNGPVVAVSTRLSCSPQVTPRCSGGEYLLESAAAFAAIESYASQRGVRLVTSYQNRIPCRWSDSTAAETGVGLSVLVPHIRENRVQVGISVSCVGSRRDPGEGFFEGFVYHMELVDGKWKVKATISGVVT